MGLPLEVAKEYISKYPDISTRAMTRLLMNKEPKIFEKYDATRYVVRYARGESSSHGYMHKNAVGVRTKEDRRKCLLSGVGLPSPAESWFEVVQLPDDCKLWLILNDIHIPYHDASLDMVFVWIKRNKIKVDGVLLNGDILDFYGLSWWEKDPRNRTFKGELDDGVQFIKFVKEQLKPKHIIWKLGNHEARWDRYLQAKAPELLDVADWKNYMRLDDLGVQIVKSGCPIQHKDLYILHGDEYGKGLSNPVNPARGIFLKSSTCTLVGHEHRTSQHVETSLSGISTTCWSVGCLCDLHPRYRPLNKWNHGFALLHTGHGWEIDNKRIINGMIK